MNPSEENAVSREDCDVNAALNDFDPGVRAKALGALLAQPRVVPASSGAGRVNLHCHSFYSFNGYGYSPTCLAWRAHCEGLDAAGIVDFDVLDGVDEFMAAAARLRLRACAGIETRVFVPELADQEINSPGEPGIAYFMGIGFPSGAAAEAPLLQRLKRTAQERNREIVARVNRVLAPVELDYDAEVLPLTPSGNATERHVCIAYAEKAQALFPDGPSCAAFWSAKLGVSVDQVMQAFQSPPALHGLIRGKLMKAGGPGYIPADGAAFPQVDELIAFIRGAGALPCYAWLDGLSEAERNPERLLDLFADKGIAAVNIIPDRNWNIADPDLRAKKTAKLHEFARLADARDLPIAVGTEMNAYGQPFVDDFAASEMAPLVALFQKGAHAVCGHTLLQRCGMGMLSDWAADRLPEAASRNAFYARIGSALTPGRASLIDALAPEWTPEKILEAAAGVCVNGE